MPKVFSPSASLEANAVKNEVNFHTGGKKRTKTGIMRRVREAMDPSKAASIYLDAAKTTTQGLAEIAEQLKACGTPPELAIPQAYEIFRGHQKLTNISNILEWTESKLDDEKEYTVPSSAFLNDFISASEDVTDEEIQQMFGAILAGEMETPGAFSKRAISILSTMNRCEAISFEKLCRYSTYGISRNEKPCAAFTALDLDKNGQAFGEGILSMDEALSLSSLGLISLMQDITTFTVCEPEITVLFRANGVAVLGTNRGERDIKVHLGQLDTTPIGEELSRVCELATGDGLLEIIERKLKNLGLEIKTMPLDEVERQVRSQKMNMAAK